VFVRDLPAWWLVLKMVPDGVDLRDDVPMSIRMVAFSFAPAIAKMAGDLVLAPDADPNWDRERCAEFAFVISHIAIERARLFDDSIEAVEEARRAIPGLHEAIEAGDDEQALQLAAQHGVDARLLGEVFDAKMQAAGAGRRDGRESRRGRA
jgi:hypothetical protein